MRSKEEQNRILNKSVKQEKRSAENYNGSRNVMSGAGWVRKNDVRTEDLLIENKFTEKQSYSLKLADLIKLTRVAVKEDRIPVMQIDISGRSYVVLCETDFMEMIANEQ